MALVDFSLVVQAVPLLKPIAVAYVALGVVAIVPQATRWGVNKLVNMFEPDADDMELVPIDKDYSAAFDYGEFEQDDMTIEFADASDAFVVPELSLFDEDEEDDDEALEYGVPEAPRLYFRDEGNIDEFLDDFEEFEEARKPERRYEMIEYS